MPIDMNAVAAEVAGRIQDYRDGEIVRPTREHVLRWLEQFEPPARESVLTETNRFLSRLYISKARTESFVSGLIDTKKLVGEDAQDFWSGVGFLRLQRRSRSQRDMLSMLSSALTERFNINADSDASRSQTYIYIDDAIFTGRQTLQDLKGWIEGRDIRNVRLHVIVIGWHKSGQWYANKELKKVIQPRGIQLTWWRLAEIEDWKKSPEDAAKVDVLWPTQLPNEPSIRQWLTRSPQDEARFTPRPRLVPPNKNANFTSEDGREILEQAFLQRGAYITTLPQSPDQNMHPLGYHNLNGTGFGTLFSTYRNCPNNCPLVLWWGDPEAGAPLNRWYPLLPRRTRAQNFDFDEVVL